MSTCQLDDFTNAVITLHREKDRAYGSAWKRRGEVLSIVANIARKVDRVENSTRSPVATRDESLIDTAVDLLIYSLKYQTFLADLDDDVAESLFDEGVEVPYSSGVAGFEVLLQHNDLARVFDERGPVLDDATASVVDAFAGLEGWIATAATPDRRLRCATELVTATIDMVGALRREHPREFAAFIAVWLEGKPPSNDDEDFTSLVIRLASDFRDQLAERAAERGISISELLRRSVALDQFVWEHRNDLLASHRTELRQIMAGE